MNNKENSKLKNEESQKNKFFQSDNNNQYDEKSNYNKNHDEENITNNHYENQSEFNNESLEENEVDERQRKKILHKPLKIFGGILVVISIVGLMLSGRSNRVDTTASAQNALTNKVSTSISAGTVLLAKDENTQAKDYTISHNSNSKDTKIWVWDYAGEDGDYVQVLVDGTPMSEAFMIRHKPKEFTVPAVSTVQIKGIRDGAGGITYAVRYDLNGTSYFNSAPEGELNTYTLVKG